MNGEDRRHPRAGPDCPSHALQRQEQENRRDGVEEHVGQMMAGGLQAIELAVEHVREPGQRVPVSGLEGSDCRDNPVFGQAPPNMLVFVDVVIVVEADEVVAAGLAKDGDHRD